MSQIVDFARRHVVAVLVIALVLGAAQIATAAGVGDSAAEQLPAPATTTSTTEVVVTESQQEIKRAFADAASPSNVYREALEAKRQAESSGE